MKNALLVIVLSVFSVVLSSCGISGIKLIATGVAVETLSPALARGTNAFTESGLNEESAHASAAKFRCAFIDKFALEMAKGEFICTDFLPYLSE